MKRKLFFITLVMFLFISLTTTNYAQNNKDVEVSIPTSNVRVNGTVINNQQNKYPMIVYKDIFYLPLTEGYSRALGLITSWYKEDEFVIVQDYNFDAPIQILSEDNNLNVKHYARILDSKITINEEKVINNQEAYAFLSFRDTVYMPITTKFVEKFDWKLFWNEKDGLNILSTRPEILYSIVVDDWIYFQQKFKLYKMKADGSEKTMFADSGSVFEMIVNGDWIYYINGDDDSKLYKIKTDGTKKTKLSDENTAGLIGVDSDIYYIKGENYSYTEPNTVYKMDLDGNGRSRIDNLELGSLSFPILNNGWIYYTNVEDAGKLYKIRTNGMDKTKLTDVEVLDPQIVNEWIFYFDTSDYHIYKVKFDGSEKTKITDERPYSYIIDEEWMYYTNREDNGTLYKIRLDGSEKRKLNNDRSNVIDVHGDYAYFKDYLGPDVYSLSFARININNYSREVLLPNGPTKYYYIAGQKIKESNSGKWLSDNLKISYLDTNNDLASSIEIIQTDSSKVSFVKYNSDYINSYSNISLHEVKIDKESQRLIHTSDRKISEILSLEVNERYIKWEELYKEGVEFFVNVYVYDLDSNKKRIIKQKINCSLGNSFYRIHTTIDNNYVAWLENHQDEKKSYIKIYDLTSDEEKTIATIDFIERDDSRKIPITFVDMDNGKIIFDEKSNDTYYYNIYDIEKESTISRIKATNNVIVHFGSDYDSKNDLLAIYFAGEDKNGYYGELGYIDMKTNKYYKIYRQKNDEMVYKDRIQLKNGYLAYNIQKYVSGYIYDHYFGYIVDFKKEKTIELEGSFEVKLYEDNIGNLSYDREKNARKINYEIMNIDEIFKSKNIK